MKKLKIILPILILVAVFAVGFTAKKKADFTFNGSVVFNGTVIDSGKVAQAHTPFHRDTFTLSAGYTVLDTSVTTDTIVLRLPTSPYYGAEVKISSVSAITSVTYIGTTSNANTAFTAGQAVAFTYIPAKSKWYRSQ